MRALFQRYRRLLPRKPPDVEQVEKSQRETVKEKTKEKEREQKATKVK